ncbi:DNA-directed RNA polymerase subunit delta [Phosphitispora sp. TUW77]|uniref:DNA-directed RNA polymerase subunit delta n=1 Tax=Phosphitispora sp. TUW77 TaxID=3152361 RepID=UPI003AB6E90B
MPEFNTEQVSSCLTEADLAHAILKAAGAPLYFKDLFEQVMAIKPVSGRDREHIMAGIHTDINLDGRFIHVGKGVWGLREWVHDRRAYLYSYDEELDN